MLFRLRLGELAALRDWECFEQILARTLRVKSANTSSRTSTDGKIMTAAARLLTAMRHNRQI